jgi:FkbM family methyltransferase
MIPIIIITYNNYKYVENTIKQLIKINKDYENNIQILNNCSTCSDTIAYLKTLKYKIIENTGNHGPRVNKKDNRHIYDILPDKYILTDPDLEFNENMPSNYIEHLSKISDELNIFKLGLALDITDSDKFYQYKHPMFNLSIAEIEAHYWKNYFKHNNYDLYAAPVDTTFALYNKNAKNDNVDVRIAGNFTAKHMPWYIETKLFNLYENYMLYKDVPDWSSGAYFIRKYINENYKSFNYNNELILIPINDSNLSKWDNDNNEIIKILDKYLDKNKIFIDIGGWIGKTSIYGSRKAKKVYVIEADKKVIVDLKKNLKNNSYNNYEIIEKAIYYSNDVDVKFGNSQICLNSGIIYDPNLYNIKTINLNELVKDNINEIFFINVDINGSEEFIIEDLIKLNKNYKIPIHIKFYYNRWNNKDINRFSSFLSDEMKNKIKTNSTVLLE